MLSFGPVLSKHPARLFLARTGYAGINAHELLRSVLLQERRRLDLQCDGDALDVVDGHIFLGALEHAKVRAMYPGLLGKFLLRQSELETSAPNIGGEYGDEMAVLRRDGHSTNVRRCTL